MKMVECKVSERTVSERNIVCIEPGIGGPGGNTCIPCMSRSIDAWIAEDCPFCTGAATRLFEAICEYKCTGEVQKRPEVPADQIPRHRPGCRFEYSDIDRSAT